MKQLLRRFAATISILVPKFEYQFQLSILPEQYVEYYRGTVQQVLVKCSNGLTLQFPASLLQKFVTNEGIHGHFVLTCDENHKCIQLRRLSLRASSPGG